MADLFENAADALVSAFIEEVKAMETPRYANVRKQ
jgi:hypothetical protein